MIFGFFCQPIVVVGILLAVGIVDSRTPFYTERSGNWSVGHGQSPGHELKITGNRVISPKMIRESDPSTEFLADPFFLKDTSGYFMFFERKRFKSNACISALHSIDGKSYKYLGDVIKEKFHLSYPQVFKHKEHYYMLPETQGSNHVLLYKAVDFPIKWEIVDTLLFNIKLKDPTLFLSDTLNIMVGSDHNHTMYMYESDGLHGTWKLHKKSIVMTGTESRPGGRFFIKNGHLILPVQNCSKGYGTGVSLYRFKFGKGDYTVTPHQKMVLGARKDIPEFNFGMHHLDMQPIEGGTYYVYDGINVTNKPKRLNLRASAKMTFYDVINLYHRMRN